MARRPQCGGAHFPRARAMLRQASASRRRRGMQSEGRGGERAQQAAQPAACSCCSLAARYRTRTPRAAPSSATAGAQRGTWLRREASKRDRRRSASSPPPLPPPSFAFLPAPHLPPCTTYIRPPSHTPARRTALPIRDYAVDRHPPPVPRATRDALRPTAVDAFALVMEDVRALGVHAREFGDRAVCSPAARRPLLAARRASRVAPSVASRPHLCSGDILLSFLTYHVPSYLTIFS